MRIALVIERMTPARGGREVSTAQTAWALVRAGHDVTVLCQRSSWECENVRVVQLAGGGLLRVQRIDRFVGAVQAMMAEERYDIVHATLPIPGANVYQPRGGTIPGQIAASCRRWGALGGLRRALAEPLNFCRRRLAGLERRVVADPNAFCLAVSEMVAREFRDAYGQKQRLRVVYNAVDVPDCDDAQRADWRQATRFRLGVDSEDPVFLVVATNFRLKAVAETIRAFARWYHAHGQRGNARLVVVGRELVEGYQRLASMHDVGRLVVFVPPTDEVFRWYAAADAVVLLSWYDPCSRVVLEATRWGIPSITTVYNGAAEVLGEGAGIVVASPRRIRAVAEALGELADAERRAERAEACLRKADFLSMDRHIEELLDVYAEAAGGN